MTQGEGDFGGAGVLDDVLQSFLKGEDEFVPDLGADLHVGPIDGGNDAAGDLQRGEVAGGVLREVFGGGSEGVVLRIHRPHHFVE